MIEIEAPDGAVVEFPDGTPDAVIEKAMQDAYGAPQAAPPAPPQGPAGVTGIGLLDAGLTGVRQGLEGMGGMFGDANQMQGDLASWAAGKFGASPETQETASKFGRRFSVMPKAPTTEEIRTNLTKPVVGENYEPRTIGEEYMRTGGQFAPAALAGPGSLARRVAMTAIPAVASETAGQVARKQAPEYEPIARGIGALVGGVASAGKFNPKAPKPTQATSGDWKTKADDAFGRMRQEGVIFTKQAVDEIDTKLTAFLTKRGYWPDNQPGIKGGLAMIKDYKARGGLMTPDGLLALKQRFSGGYIMGNKNNNAMVREAISLIDDILKNPKKGFVTASGDPAKAAAAYRDGMTASRVQHQLEDVEYLVNKGQRQGDRNIIDNANKRVKTLLSDKLLDPRSPMSRGWNPAQKAAIQKASSWSGLERLAHAASGAAPQGKLTGAAHMVLGSANLATGNIPGLVGQAAGAGAGWAAGKLADALARKPVAELTRLIASGGVPAPVTQQVLQLLEKSKREALVRSLLAAESGKNSALANAPLR